MPDPAPDTVAAIDLGSNSFHMIVARAGADELVVVDRLREMVRLAAGLDENARLDPAVCERALDCLRRFGQRIAHMAPDAVRAVGTNTLRRAQNAARFIEDAEMALGHPIETISGIEEARLVWLGALHGLEDRGLRRLVLDIGGGSTEIIVGDSSTPLALDSLFVGCVSMSRDFFPDGRIDASSWRRAELHAQTEFEPLTARYKKLGWEEVIGTSGTIRTVETVVHAAGWDDRGITPQSIAKLRDTIIATGNVEKVELEGLKPERRPVFPGGVVLLSTALDVLGIEVMKASDSALREGVLLDLLGRIRHEDARDRSVAALIDRNSVDLAQAERVERTALALLEQVAGSWKLRGRDRDRFLAWGARLHEVGILVAHAHYHKHGEYIVAQSDLPGFSRDEQRIVATLVRAHRRKFPLSVVRALPSSSRRACERLCVLLRLSCVLHRSRDPDPLPELRLKASKRTLALSFPAGWLDEHPLTRADLEQERGFLTAADYRLTFE